MRGVFGESIHASKLHLKIARIIPRIMNNPNKHVSNSYMALFFALSHGLPSASNKRVFKSWHLAPAPPKEPSGSLQPKAANTLSAIRTKFAPTAAAVWCASPTQTHQHVYIRLPLDASQTLRPPSEPGSNYENNILYGKSVVYVC